jgi:hypothetical protein
MLRNLKLRRDAYMCAYHSLRFSARLREDASEFAATTADTLERVGDEIATLARDYCTSERERRQLLQGLDEALKAMGLSGGAKQEILTQLAPRVLAGAPLSAGRESWTRMAV